MKKMLLLCILVVFLAMVFSSCTKDVTDSSSLSSYIANTTKVTYDEKDVLKLIAAKGLKCEIDNIKWENTSEENTAIFIELYVSKKEFDKNIYFEDKIETFWKSYSKRRFEAYDVELDSIIDSGINYETFIVKKDHYVTSSAEFSDYTEEEYRPYEIHWYRTDEILKDNYKILVYTNIPYKITIEDSPS